MFARSVSDDEMTMLMPRKGVAAPIAVREPSPVMPKSRPAGRPRAVLEDPPTRQFVRTGLAHAQTQLAPAQELVPMRDVGDVAPSVPSTRAAVPASSRSASAPKGNAPKAHAGKGKAAYGSDSDVRVDPPATVITARTRILPMRPTLSWAAALVAMGVFVGLVTAVVARGDADSLIDATASLVDPSGTHASGVAAGTLSTKFVEPVATLPSRPDTTLSAATAANKDDGDAKQVALADLPTASPTPQRPAPVAYAAPVSRPHPVAVAPRPQPKPAPVVAHEDKAEKTEKVEKMVAVAKVTPKAEKAEKADKPAARAAHSSDDDVESATAADALARAQLEASLR